MNCLQVYIKARFGLQKPMAEWQKMTPKTEVVFEFLVLQAEKNGFNVKQILEIPGPSGITCFNIASQFSKKISRFIIDRNTKLTCIKAEMIVPSFACPDLVKPMLKRGVNPFVIDCNGNREVDLWQDNFKDEEVKRLLRQFPRSIHFAIEDINCDSSCPKDCTSNYRKFYFKNGELVKMTDSNRIGQGGFGNVFKATFHGKTMAMKQG